VAEHEHKHDKHEAHRRIVEMLRRTADDVRRLSSGLDESQLATRTVPAKWSMKELVCHLRRVQDLFNARLDAMLSQDNPELAPYEPEGDAVFDQMAARPTADSLTAFLQAREALLERLARLTPEEWHRKGRHPVFARYDVHFQVEYMAHHEAHHVYQMFERRIPFGLKLPH
jgi:hypothetical protein